MHDASFTRGAVTHAYYPAPVYTIRTPGAVRVSMRKNNSNPWMQGIPMVWPISRPSTYPMPNGAPFYVNGYGVNELVRAGAPRLLLTQPNKMMDPTDQSTWQRPYRFTS